MSKGNLSFSLPEETNEFRLAVYAGDLYSGVWDFASWLRDQTKHDHGHSPAKLEALAEIRSQFWSTVMERLPDELR